ncbi:hypothetical protein [Arthrobacter sp. JSM 101049]|uniref:hypothetical protein n=1 Tax=Arthrobacter sp. JSM 101049 TaxID=929097 RepID=UPI003567CD80
MRTAGSALLMIMAALLACAAVAGSAVDRLAHTAGPVRRIAGDLPRDEAVRTALPAVLAHAVRSGVPAGIFVPDALEGPLERASAHAVDAALDSPGFQDAWLASLDASREAYVDRLEEVRAGSRDTAEVTLELGPLASHGVADLKKAAGDVGLGFLIDSLQTDITASVPLAFPVTDAAGSARIATVVWLSAAWAWAALGAVVLAIAGFIMAHPRRRGWSLVLGGLVVCLGAVGLLTIAAGLLPDAAPVPVGQDPAAGLAAAAQARVMEGLSDYVTGWAVPALVGGGVVVVVGGVMRLLVGRPRNR